MKEPASKLADALSVPLDYLCGKTDTELDSATLGRIMEISVTPEDGRKQVFLVVDALIGDSGTADHLFPEIDDQLIRINLTIKKVTRKAINPFLYPISKFGSTGQSATESDDPSLRNLHF